MTYVLVLNEPFYYKNRKSGQRSRGSNMKNDLKHLRRSELIDLIYEMKKREIELQTRLDEAEAKLQAREITMEKAGTIADAAVELSGVFQAAQEAADTYLKSIKAKEKELARLTKQAKKNMRD